MAIDPTALFSLSYGLFVLTARDGDRDCGCIVNTVMQLTETPLRIVVSVNKRNHTNDVIARTGVFNVSVLTEEATMDVFKHFGFQSGRDVDKFADRDDPVSENGLRYLVTASNALISAKVEQQIDCGTHILYIAQVTQAQKWSNAPSMTYSYYFANVKPKKPAQTETPRRGYVCRICGYFYEGETLPPDYVCPLCKHGADAFDPVGF